MRLNRRQFLGVTAGAFAARATLRAGGAASAGIKRATRPFGFSLYGMRQMPPLDAIDLLTAIGYRQLELPLLAGFPTDLSAFSRQMRRDVRARIEGNGLQLASVLLNLNLAGDDSTQASNLAAVSGAGQLARDLAPERVPVIESIAGGKIAMWDSIKDRLVVRLRDCAAAAHQHGTKLCIKAHADQAINSPERLLWVYRQVDHPGLALTYDYSHFQYEGYALDETLRELLPYTRFIHVKDVTPHVRPARFQLVGTSGAIDYPRYFRLLDDLGYAGPLIVEVSAQIHGHAGYDPVATARQCFAFMTDALAHSTA